MNGLRIMGLHPADGEWRAYLDGEVEPGRRDELIAHLARCAPCRGRLAQAEEAARLASAKLRALQIAVGSVESSLPPAEAPHPRKEERRMKRFVRPLVVAAAVLLLFLAPLAVSPGLRAKAAELFTVIRFQKIEVMRVSSDDVAKMRYQAQPEIMARLTQLLFPSLDAQLAAAPPMETRTEADAVRKGLKVPRYLPKGMQAYWGIQYTPAWEVSHQLDIPALNQALADAGVRYRMPVMREAEIVLRTGDEFVHRYTDGTQTLEIIQQGRREFGATQGIDLGGLLAVIVAWQAQEQGASPELVNQLLETDLLGAVHVPLAQGEGGEVKVTGATGVFREGATNRLIWMVDGQSWTMLSTLPKEEMLKIAESIQ